MPVESLPTSAVSLDILKVLEVELLRRSILPPRGDNTSHPLWFIAETERNVFLWRSGLSISQQDEFDFWVDLPAIISKRLKQLECQDSNNPFINPFWGISCEDGRLSIEAETANQSTHKEETEYLSTLLGVLSEILPHAHALSHVGSLLAAELAGCRRETVLLPYLQSGQRPKDWLAGTENSRFTANPEP